jgi:hypothetical protein
MPNTVAPYAAMQWERRGANLCNALAPLLHIISAGPPATADQSAMTARASCNASSCTSAFLENSLTAAASSGAVSESFPSCRARDVPARHMALALSYRCGACRTTIGDRHLWCLWISARTRPMASSGSLRSASADASPASVRRCRQRLRTCSITRSIVLSGLLRLVVVGTTGLCRTIRCNKQCNKPETLAAEMNVFSIAYEAS